MSVKATVQLALTVLETLTTGVADVASPTVRHDQFNIGPKSLSASSTPPASQVSSSTQTGTQTLDCTNLPGVNGAVVNGNALKVQAVLISVPATASGPLSVAQGAANPLDLTGAGATAITIPAGGAYLKYYGGNGPTIGGTAKNVLFTPHSGGDTYNVQILMG